MKHFQRSYSVSAWCLCQQQAGFVSSFIISALLSAESVAQDRFQPWQMLFFQSSVGAAAEDGSVQMLLDSWDLMLHPDPIPRWEFGACHSHTPHCCPPPWREIWVTVVKGAALFLDWVWSLTDQQPKVPRKSQVYLLCSPCEKTGLRSLNLRCRFFKRGSERNHILQYAMCCSTLICNVTRMTLGVQCDPDSRAPCGGTAEPSPCHVRSCNTHPALTWKLGGF